MLARKKKADVTRRIGTRGPPPTPSNILDMRGSTLPKYDRPNEPKPVLITVDEAPPPPPELKDKAAIKCWKRHIRELCELGIYTKLDRQVFVVYCNSWAEYLHATKMLRKQGNVIMSPTTGDRKVNPWLKVQQSAYTMWSQTSRELGMSASSRARLSIVVAEGEVKSDKSRHFSS